MKRLEIWSCIGIAVVVCGCSAGGEEDAQRWIREQSSERHLAPTAALPTLIDTLPAAFTAKDVIDPFSPTRIVQTQQGNEEAKAGFSEKVRFGDSPLDALRVVGFLEVQRKYIGLVEGPSGFVHVHVGDLLGNAQAEITGISAKGIQLRQADGAELWLLTSKRSR